MATFYTIAWAINNVPSPNDVGLFHGNTSNGSTGIASISPIPLTITGYAIMATLPIGASASIQMLKNGQPVPPMLTLTNPNKTVSITGLSIPYAATEPLLLRYTADYVGGAIQYIVSYRVDPPYDTISIVDAARRPGVQAGPGAYSLDSLGPLTPESSVQMSWPISGTFQTAAIYYQSPSGGTSTFAIQLRINNNTAWTITLPPSPAPATNIVTDISTKIPVNAGDLVNYQIVRQTGSDAYVQLLSVLMGFSI